MRQLLVRSRYLLFKTPHKWTPAQKERADILFRQFDDLKQLYYLNLQLGKIYSTNYDNVAKTKLALWFYKVKDEIIRSLIRSLRHSKIIMIEYLTSSMID